MNGLKSFYTLEDGLKHMIGKKVALFQVDSSNLYSLENGECKVQSTIFVDKYLLQIYGEISQVSQTYCRNWITYFL